jgi:hypothetical protein
VSWTIWMEQNASLQQQSRADECAPRDYQE